MSEIKFIKKWNEYSKLDKTGYILYWCLQLVFILLIIYNGYIKENILSMFRLTYMVNGNFIQTNFWDGLAFLSMFLGLFKITKIYYNLVEKVFYPESNEERKIKNEIKKIKKKYNFKRARYEIGKLNAEYKLKEYKEKIKEWKLKNE